MNTKSFISKKRIAILLQALMIALWLFILRFSDSFFVPYMVIGVFSLFCMVEFRTKSRITSLSRRDQRAVIFFALLFVLMVTAANYRLWKEPPVPEETEEWLVSLCGVLAFLGLVLGGWIVFWNIFRWLTTEANRIHWSESSSWKPWKVFVSCFLAVTFVDLFVLYFSKYPGVLTYDSIDQIQQGLSGKYSNHHPILHTQLIRLWFNLGLSVSEGDVNAGAAAYSIFQVVVIALCFAMAVMTMAEMKAPKWMLIGSVIFYAVMPYHILHSFTMWKDILFSGAVLLFGVSLFRWMKGIGHVWLNRVIFCLAGMIICLLRSNGLIAYVLLLLLAAILFRWKQKGLIITMAMVIVLSLGVRYTAVRVWKAEPTELVESLSIPLQQVARVITYENDLSSEEYELLSKTVNVEEVPETYMETGSDPIKDLVYYEGDETAIQKNKGDFLQLYFALGLRHPLIYLEAWIEETRGYWNGGYDDHWSTGVLRNQLEIVRTVRNDRIDHFLNTYLTSFEENGALHLFVSIGFTIWLYLGALAICIFRRDKIGSFEVLPILVINFTLLLATPVFSEFRYIYAAFCMLPFSFAVVTRPSL